MPIATQLYLTLQKYNYTSQFNRNVLFFYGLPPHCLVVTVQTCEDASCPFSRMLTLQAQTDLCPEVFNIPQHSLPGHIAFTNKYYGGDHPDTDRVLYVNGEQRLHR